MANVITTRGRSGTGFLTLPELVLTAYSKKLEFQAEPALKFDQFAIVKTDLSANAGDRITFFKYDNLTRGGALTEGTPMETQAIGGAQVHITVQEYGNAISVTEFLLTTSFASIMEDSANLLGRDYGMVIDEIARDILLTGTNEVYAGSAADADSITSTDYLTMKEVKDAVEILATNNARKIGNDHWAAVVSPHQSRGLRDDPDWITVGKLDPQRLYQGEIGRVDDVIFVETTQVDVSPNSAGTPVNIHSAVVLGEGAFGKAVAKPVEMRDNGVEDFGRQRSLGWIATLGEGILNDDNFVIVKTA